MKRVPLGWTTEARDDLRRIGDRIAAEGNPKNAREFVSQLRRSVNVLRRFPEAGSLLTEKRPDLREIYHDDYRLIYRYRGGRVDMLMVVHGAKLVRIENFPE